MTFEQIVRVSPAFDKRDPDPKKNYGLSCARITFILKGPKGAVQFMMSTGWYMEITRQEILRKSHKSFHQSRPLDNTPGARGFVSSGRWTRAEYDEFTVEEILVPKAWDLGYHSIEPHYEEQSSMKCDLVPSGRCYYDGSSLNAEPVLEKFLSGGTEWLWPYLEKYYASVFEGADYPSI